MIYNPTILEPEEPEIIGYDWKGKEIYAYEREEYLLFDTKTKTYKVNKDELLEFACEHLKDDLLEYLLDYADTGALLMSRNIFSDIEEWGCAL